MTKSGQRILKITTISLGSVLLGLILLGTALRLLLVEYLAVDCSLSLRYGWYVELQEFAKAHPEKKYPPMSSTPGVLFLTIESMRPQFISNNSRSFCIAADSAYKALTIEQQFANPTLA